jgi:IS30 family transposase
MGGHLTEGDRYHIKAQLEAGKTQAEIAIKLKVDKSTISRELKRNSGLKGYRPKQANKIAIARWRAAEKATKLTPALAKYLADCLRKDWSPEQISGRMRLGDGVTLSHERIYRFIGEDKAAGGDLWTHLRWSHRKRKKRYGLRDRRGEIRGRRSIEKRKRKANKKEKNRSPGA